MNVNINDILISIKIYISFEQRLIDAFKKNLFTVSYLILMLELSSIIYYITTCISYFKCIF